MESQSANPGGTLAPEEVVGRDELVERLWRILERGSVYLTGERRMGKSSVVRDKMGSAIPQGWTFLYMDVSRAVSPLQFVEKLLEASQNYSEVKTGKFRLFQTLNRLAGAEIKWTVGLKLPDTLKVEWKTLLNQLLSDLSQLDGVVVLAFDELPLMLDAIRRGEGEPVVMEILDTLRAVREETELRMVYMGSLGIHHVLTRLREIGYQNAPVNNMQMVNLEPLSQEFAKTLALRLLRGEKVSCDTPDEIAAHIAKETDGIAFYIQHTIAELGISREKATKNWVDDYLRDRLNDPLDPWEFAYYDERIDTHYPSALRPIARAALDALATQPPKTLEEIVDGIDPQKIACDRETALRTMRLLGLDHYLAFEGNRYRFCSPFIQRAWRCRRGLEA